MEKKVILLTGASGGLGSEIAKLLAKDNRFLLALQGNSSKISIPETESIAHFKANLKSREEINSLIEDVVKRFGRLDVLINNAGVSESNWSWKTSAESWEETMAINLNAPFYLSQAAIPEFRKGEWGRIINISSVVAQTGFVGTAAYAASKAGLLGLTKTLSKELAHFNVSVNALALGYFDRGMINSVPDEQLSELKKQIPMKELGQPSTIVETLLWLISEQGAYITGQTINLNGGLYS
ncbi:MAG: NAD(P)-dependent dehydrogenase (short-subunit alcohol dehydrogenase family) [Lentimonas sp.]|jgi:NAD(P)-dependent dehydrogenase (short-subunit alcohol dehydrogenase family)